MADAIKRSVAGAVAPGRGAAVQTRSPTTTRCGSAWPWWQRAKAGGQAITVDIRRNGQQLFHCALAGTSADNDEWILRKSRVVDRYGHSSFYVGTQFRARGTTFEASSRLDPDRYAAHGGAFPIIVRNVGPVGTVTVSGLPQEEDHALVVAVLREFLAA